VVPQVHPPRVLVLPFGPKVLPHFGDQALLRHPVHPIRCQRPVSSQVVQHCRPLIQHARRLRVPPPVALRRLAVPPLHVQRRNRSAPLQVHDTAAIQVVRHLAYRPHGISQPLRRTPTLHRQVQRQRHGPHLHRRRPFAAVRVACDHVQPPVFSRVRVRLVPRVEDRTPRRRVDPGHFLEEVRPLRHLQLQRVATLDPNPTRSRKHLPRRQERHRHPDQIVRRNAPRRQVVLVAAIAAAVIVRVVLQQSNLAVSQHRVPRRLGREHHPLARLVLRHQVLQRQAHVRAVLWMIVVVV